jgi:transcriptional regulator with XRE-family HTH domain
MKDSGFADRLALAMRERGLSQTSFAEALAVSPSTVSRWLAGSVPRKLVAAGIAQYLDVDTDWLRTGTGDEFYFSAIARPMSLPDNSLDRLEAMSLQEKHEHVSRIIDEKRLGVGLRVHVLRNKLGLSLGKFADECGFTSSYLSRLEGGSRSNPSFKFLESVSSSFGVSQKWLELGEPPIMIEIEGRDLQRTINLRELEIEEMEKFQRFRRKNLAQIAAFFPPCNKQLLERIESLKSKGVKSKEDSILARTLTEVLIERLSLSDSKSEKKSG